MSRPLRIKFPGAWYHIMCRGQSHQRIYFTDKHRHVFLKFLAKTVSIYGIEIHAYCLMDNHYHLIVHTPRGNISDAMKHLNSTYARFLNIDLQRDGHVFRGRFHAIVISEDSYLLKLSRYIHRNPLALSSTVNLAAYKWSSYPAYISAVASQAWLTRNEVIKRFGDAEFSLKYKSYVESDEKYDINHFLDKPRMPPAIGDEEFIRQIDEYVKTHSLSAEIVGADRILAQPDINDLLKSIALHLNHNVNTLRTSTNGKRSTIRNIAILICREFGGYSLIEIARIMGITYKAVGSVLRRVKSDNAQMQIADELMRKLSATGKTISMLRQPEG